MGKKKSKKPQGPDEIDQALAELPPLPPELATAKPKPMVPLKATPEEMRRPFVSVLCVTYNRRPFIPTFLEMVRNQDYPQSRIEIIIVDDGTDPIKDIVDAAAMPNVRYYRMETKVPLGTKRSYANSLIDKKTKYVIPMDDDDVMMSKRSPPLLLAQQLSRSGEGGGEERLVTRGLRQHREQALGEERRERGRCLQHRRVHPQ
jgi:hypothetical protein